MKPSPIKPKTTKHLLPKRILEDLGFSRPRHKQDFSLLSRDEDYDDNEDETDDTSEEPL